jgi:hypothetical protein
MGIMIEITLQKYDDCCYSIDIIEDGETVETGIWCPKSGQVVVNGRTAGWCDSKEEVISRLKPVMVRRWVCVD